MSNDNAGFALLGKKIKQVRSERHMTQTELSEGIVTRNMLSRIENGAALPSIPVLCRLAERLDMPVGYFADDANDGSQPRNRRLLDMIFSEFRAEHYDLCLTYCEAIDDYDEIVADIREHAHYRLAVQTMEEGRLTDAHKMFSSLSKDIAKNCAIVNDCYLYRALLAGFLSDPQSGREEFFLRSLSEVAVAPHDLTSLATVLRLLEQKDVPTAQAFLNCTVFAIKSYELLCNARIRIAEKRYADARNLLIEASGYNVPPPVKCYVLTLLEKCSAHEKDFEKAYAYMETRRDLVRNLTKKF